MTKNNAAEDPAAVIDAFNKFVDSVVHAANNANVANGGRLIVQLDLDDVLIMVRARLLIDDQHQKD